METQAQNTDAQPERKKGARKLFEVGNTYASLRKPKIWTQQELFEQQVRRDLKTAAKQFSPAALQFLASVLNDTNESTRNRMNAAQQILDRAHGKATTHSEVKVDVYDRMSDKELLEAITGKTIDAQVIEEVRGNMIEDRSNNEP